MDQEISYARGAGLDYWAFLTYPEGDAMSSALDRYLHSVRRAEIGFCLILHQTLGVPEARWPRERDRTLQLLKESGYQKVHGRQLVYTFGLQTGLPIIRARLDDLTGAAKGAGMDPYYVYMGWNPSRDYQNHSGDGFAAVSAYAHPGAEPNFAEYLAAFEKQSWGNAQAHQTPYVPLVTTGWDKRPRQDHAVSWEKNPDYAKQATFPATATPEEIAAHLRRALRFVEAHPFVCAANTIIMYAWNEHDEGGWLCPTWTPSGEPDTSRLDAIREILNPRR